MTIPIRSISPIQLTTEIMDKCPYFSKTTFQDIPSYFNGDNLMLRGSDIAIEPDLFIFSDYN